MEGKREHEETQSESLSPKRIRLEEDEDADDTTQQASSHEDDEEFTVESDSNSEHAPSDSEDDFSDYNEDDEDGGETIIVNGIQGECKDNGEGKYSLHYTPNGREIKIITDETNIQNAIAASSEKLKDHLIPVFKLTGLEVSKDDDAELIVYAQQLSLLSEDYPKHSEGKGQEADDEHQHVCGALLKIENRDETFITTDLMDTKS